MSSRGEKRFLMAGFGLVIFGLLCNIWVLSFLFSRDGITSWRSKMGIWIFQAFLWPTQSIFDAGF